MPNSTIPFKVFSGYLKQHAHGALSPLEQELFDFLFPAFQGTSDSEEAYAKAISNPIASAFKPLIEITPPERRPRRYAGHSLPRYRYHVVCADSSGNDSQTLAHEFRAYRNPIDTGKVEVLDLAGGCRLMINETVVPLKAQAAIAVLIHNPQALPDPLLQLDFQELPGLRGDRILLYLFPYRVEPARIPHTIDLRYSEVQEWFLNTFRVPSDLNDSSLPPSGFGDPTIAHSRFHFENGVPPIPDSFWAMLPTLMNPDLGGGSTADTGSALMMIGNWMRQHDTNAFVFPSARCDTAAVFREGALSHWQGWNFLDFRDAPVLGSRSARVISVVASPWAWIHFPLGVRLHIAKAGTPEAGSFALEHVVDYWARDYLGQLEALDIARLTYGQEPPSPERKPSIKKGIWRFFLMGTLSRQWVRLILQGCPAEQIERSILELQGLALPYRLYGATGRLMEMWDNVRHGKESAQHMVEASTTIESMMFQTIAKEYPSQGLDHLARTASDLEMLITFLAGAVRMALENRSVASRAGGYLSEESANGFLSESRSVVEQSCLGDEWKKKTFSLYQQAVKELQRRDCRAEMVREEAIGLQKAISESLKARD